MSLIAKIQLSRISRTCSGTVRAKRRRLYSLDVFEVCCMFEQFNLAGVGVRDWCLSVVVAASGAAGPSNIPTISDGHNISFLNRTEGAFSS